jgi:hypothetical protein
MARSNNETEQITFRVATRLLRLADAHAKRLAPFVSTRTDVLRAAIELGLDQLSQTKGPLER